MKVYEGPVVDACVHHQWTAETELVEYMSRGWQEWVGKPNTLPGGRGARPLGLTSLWADVDNVPQPASGGRLATADASLDGVRSTILADPRVERVVLTHGPGMPMPASTNAFLATEVVRAVNEWTVDRWLSGVDDRLYASMMVPTQSPEEAAREIRRVGRHERIVGISMGASGISRPFGHPVFHPVFEAAVDLDLPVLLHAGVEGYPDAPGEVAGGGIPATFTEFKILSALPLQGHMYSMIAMGLLEKYPSLRVLLAGAGISWISSFLWRFEGTYKGLRKEVPWVRRLPSDYVREHVWIGTHPLDVPQDPARLVKLVEAAGPSPLRMIFGSGYPAADRDEVDATLSWFPANWAPDVMYQNALGLFRWPGGTGRSSEAGSGTSHVG